MGSWDKAVAARIEARQSEGRVPRAIDARAMARSLNALNAVAIVDAFGRRPHPSQEGLVDTLHRIWTGALYAPRPPVGARPAPSKKKRAPRPRRGGGQGDG